MNPKSLRNHISWLNYVTNGETWLEQQLQGQAQQAQINAQEAAQRASAMNEYAMRRGRR
jgi:hypothetical protein